MWTVDAARDDDPDRPAAQHGPARSRTSRSPRTTRSRPSSARSPTATAPLYGSCETPHHLEDVAAGDHQLPRPRAERRRRRRPDPGRVPVDGRAAARDHDHVRHAAALDERQDRDVHVHVRPARRDLRVRARRGRRRRGLHALRLGHHLHEPDLRLARLRSSRQDRRRLRPHAGRVLVGGRRRGAAGDDLERPDQPETENRNATFVFEAPGRDIRYECALDWPGTFSLCVSPKSYNNLPFGPHAFHVRVLVPDEFPERRRDRLRVHGRRARPARDRDPVRAAAVAGDHVEHDRVLRASRATSRPRPSSASSTPPRRSRPARCRRCSSSGRGRTRCPSARWTSPATSTRPRPAGRGRSSSTRPHPSTTIETGPPAVIPPREDPPYFFGFTSNDPDSDVRVLARQRAVRRLRDAVRVHGRRPGRRAAHLPGARDRPGRQRRVAAGELQLHASRTT